MSDMWHLLGIESLKTLYMTFMTTLLAYVLGLPLGIILVGTAPGGIKPMPALNWILGAIINILRSIPFLILMIAVAPLTLLVIGTRIGPNATIFALVIAAAPFVARLVEQSLLEVDRGVIEAAQSMGASPLQIMRHVLLVEAKPSLLNGSMVSLTTILGYSAMAGFIGGGGLGDVAIRFGYNRFEPGIMLICIVILVVMVQILQMLGTRIAKRSDRRINQ